MHPSPVRHDLHLIGKLDVQAVLPDSDLAHAMRPRLEALGWRLMPRVIERVLDKTLPDGVHLRMDRLDLDLGKLSPEHLEQDALHALEQALSEALVKALHDARHGFSQDARLLDPLDWQLEQVTSYLVSGRVAFASLSRPFDAAARLHEVVMQQPAAFIAWLRRHAHDRHMLTRLVLQADTRGLHALLGALAPDDAAVILALLDDVLLVHVHTPLPKPLGQTELSRLLWITTLEFLLHDGGASFHRARYLGHLLEREAQRTGVDYRDLLLMLSATVSMTLARTALRSSLPAALAQLVEELGAQDRPIKEAESASGQDDGLARALDCAVKGWFEPLLLLVRRMSGRLDRLDVIARAMGPGLLTRLLRERMPREADDVLGDMAMVGAGAKVREAPWLLWAGLLQWVSQTDDRGLVSGRVRGHGRNVLKAHWLALLASRADDPNLNLRQWLHTGVAIMPQTLQPSPAEFLLEMPAVQIRRLLHCANAEHARARLRRVMAGLKPSQQKRLLDKLDPAGAVLRASQAGSLRKMGHARHFDWMLMAAEAALTASPAPSLPQQRAADPEDAACAPAHAGDDASAALFGLLDDDVPLPPSQVRLLMALLDADADHARRYFEDRRGRPQAHARWARRLSPAVLLRVIQVWQPEMAPTLRMALPLLLQAWRDTASFGVRRQIGPAMWAELLDLLAAPRPPALSDLIETLMMRWSAGRTRQAGKLRARAIQLALRGGHGSLVSALRQESRSHGEKSKQAPNRRPARAEETAHAHHVGNAGLVLFQPFLPTLFERLGLLTPDEQGVLRVQGERDASRACHLLQYLCDGRLDQPEPLLLLNKLLAGLPLSQPVAREHEATADELAICDGLMQAVTENWSALRNTTPPVLRETFLVREGKLSRKGENWHLHVQRKTVDVLLNQCPWPFSMIYHPWMSHPIHVTW